MTDHAHPRRSPRPDTHAACELCAKRFEVDELVQERALRPNVSDFIRARHASTWDEEALICKTCLGQERLDFLMDRLRSERGELSELEKDAANMASKHQALAEDIESQLDLEATFGQRIADRVAVIGGSWPFVIGFFVALLIWVALNTLWLRQQAFDPYPYILLNLFLSCLAAVQAPIIMMSQNRVSARDRLQATQDFRINLKAELEVASLHEKVDHLLHSQWQHMVELQELQLDLLTDLTKAK
jgi:uncharacterized membrane protein